MYGVRGFRIAIMLAVTAVALAVVTGCTTKSALRREKLSSLSEKQKYYEAVTRIRNDGKKFYGEKNRFLFFFDQALLFHYAGDYDSSARFIGESQQVLEDLFARSVTNEALSLMTNDKARPYRSRRFERMLLYQIAASNYLARRESDDALVEFRKANLVLQDFQSKDGQKKKYNDNGMLHFFEAMAYANEDKRSDADIALYHSVKAFRQGPLTLPGLVATEAYATLSYAGRTQDIEQLKIPEPSSGAGNAPPLYGGQSEIVVVGYAGKGPVLDETVLWATYVVDGFLFGHYHNAEGDRVDFKFPAPPLPDVKKKNGEGKKTKSGTTFHIKFAIPSPVVRSSQTRSFVARIGEKEVRSQVVCNNDVLLQTHIEDTRRRTIARTAIRVLLRTIAAQKAKAKMRTGSALANLAVNLGTDALSSQLERADTRMSIFLPKTVQVARIPVEPGTHRIEAAALAGNNSVLHTKAWDNVEVRPGEKRFVFVSSLR